VREALEVLRRQQAQTAQGLSQLESLGVTSWVEREPDARPMKGYGPAYNVQTIAEAACAALDPR